MDAKLNSIGTGAQPAAAKRRRASFAEVMSALKNPKVGIMLALGFSSGAPFFLVGNTFNYWLGDAHVDLALIGFASWVGLSYTYQFLLAPIVDSLTLPWIGRRLGRRRSWLALTQFAVMIGLLGMAASEPRAHLARAVMFALLAALGSATQDATMNGWRIESAANGMELDLLTSAYQLGYRIASILTASVILIMAAHWGWPISYAIFGVSMLIGLAATFAAREPVQGERMASKLSFGLRRGFDAVAGPFIAFFRTYGWTAALVLLTVTAYHLCDYLRGPVINPFYVQVHLPKALVGTVRLAVGLPASMIGIAAGGLIAARFGHLKAMMVGAVLQPLAVASFAILATTGPDPHVFIGLMAFDDFCMSFAGVILIAYMSTLTTLGYTATQYALLISAVNFSGKTLKGFSGAWVKGLTRGGRDLTHAYAAYFIDCALVGIPALLLVLALAWVRSRGEAEPVQAA